MSLLPPSLSGKLLFWQITCSAGILLAMVFFFYGELRQIVFASADQTLHAKAQIFTGLLHEEHGRVELELSDIIAGEYVIPRSGHYYRVMTGETILAASPSLTDNRFSFVADAASSEIKATGERLFTSRGPAGEPVRVLNYRFRAFGNLFEVTLAESLTSGLAMVDSFRRLLLLSMPLGILLLCATSWVIVRKALKPLPRFTATIETITHKNLDERIDPGATVRELAGIARSFNNMLDRLSHVFDSQKRLVADASHELKTPLAVIRTQCDVTLQKQRRPEEYDEAIRTIRSESQSMTRLVNDLLSLARLDAGGMATAETAAVSVAELVNHAVRMTAQLAFHHEVRVVASVADSLKVCGTQSSLEEALLNLVENAIRYNHAGGDVAISACREGEERIAIVVNDTGIGIVEQDQGRIFERFFRSATVRGCEGTGLGLSIVKAIAEAHGGEITVASEPARGSRFTLIVPAA